MRLGDLFNDAGKSMSFQAKGIDPKADVTGITDDTRQLQPGMVFVCIKGASFDGHDKAKEMLAMGAVCVVCERDTGVQSQLIVEDSREFYGHLCAAWYGHPEKKLKLIGVTGTNGKSTMTAMIAHVLEDSRKKVGLIGTTGIFIGGEEIERDGSTPTTPRVSELYSIFDRMVTAGCDYAVMEVTSFALEQNRIGPAFFEAAVFTNLTRDHLDYHKTMENYYLAKKKLFEGRCRAAYVNIDDEYGKRLYDEISGEKYAYSGTKQASVYAKDIRPSADGMKFWFCTSGSKPVTYPVTLNMVGRFNVVNAVAAAAVCIRLGIPKEKVASAFAEFSGVRGRCEIIHVDGDFTVVCDYAHSPDALENVLPAVRENTRGRLVCLFGCGGDRDKTKRPLMAKAVEKFADHIIVTSDNPRNEDPDDIIDEIAAGFSAKTSYDRITDRREAIFHAIQQAESGDVILLAGKGHEDYQILADDEHIHFDEREIVAEAMRSARTAVSPSVRRETLTLGEICEAVGGKSYGAAFDPDCKVYVDEISSDTRTIKKGSIFIAIKGDNFDGNAFAAPAVAKLGAVCALTERIIENTPCIVVKNSRKALLDLSGYYRKKFGLKVVGITGSVGKTTSKEMVAYALGSKYKTLKTEGNRNNEIGLPFTLFRINSATEAAAIEMGMSDFGEIRKLSRASQPDICIITNIGHSHIENLGSQEGILKAKLEILSGAKEGAPLIINGDDPLLMAERSRLSFDREVITCAIDNPDADYRAVNITSSENGVEFDIYYNGMICTKCRLPVIGVHHVLDALFAVAAAYKAGCGIEEAAEALSNYIHTGLRQHIEKKGGQTVIVDCYNAAPASMKAAIDVLCEMKPEKDGRRVLVFGDMLELGEMSERLHEEIGEYAVNKGVDLLICYGKFAKYAAKKADEMGHHSGSTEDPSMLSGYLKMKLKEGDVVLYKGSRGMHMEDIIKSVYGDNG